MALASAIARCGASKRSHPGQFSTQLNLATGALVSVQTDALAQTYANAYATAPAYAMAQASVAAAVRGELAFKFDLPIIGSGSLPIVDDFDSAADAANTMPGTEDFLK